MSQMTRPEKMRKNDKLSLIHLCLVHVIWTGRPMSKLELNVKDLLLLSFLTVAEFYNLGHIQGIIRVSQLKRDCT